MHPSMQVQEASSDHTRYGAELERVICIVAHDARYVKS